MPRVGLTPTTPFNAAGTRPEPAVSVPRARSTSPRATATAEPLLDPARDPVRVDGVADGPVRAASADQPGGELVEIGLADVHGTGVDQRGDGRGRRLGGR